MWPPDKKDQKEGSSNMKEGLPESQVPKGEGITRRNFLKGAAVVVGIDTVGLGARYIGESSKSEEELREKAVVVGKRFLPRRLGISPGVKVSSAVELPEKYVITVETSRGLAKVSVAKESFDTFTEGENIMVKFKRHTIPGEEDFTIPGISEGLGVELIEKLNS